MTQILINGLLQGSNYALLAIGYTLVFGVVRLLTLAHGQVFMAAGVAAVLAMSSLGVPLAVAALLALAVGGILGVATDLVCFRPAERGSLTAPAVASMGLGIAIQSGIVVLHGSNPVGLPNTIRSADLHLGPILISTVQLAMLVLALALMVAVHRFVFATRWGAAMRAMGENPVAVELVGVNPKTVATLTLGASGVLGGVAAVLSAIRVGAVSPFSGFEVGLTGIAIMAVAGLGSVTGAMVVGLAVGLAQAVAAYYGLGTWVSAIPWMLVIAVLLVRPQGLFSRT